MEDVKQIEYSCGDLLKMALILGRCVTRISSEQERVGVLLPNLAPTLAIIFGIDRLRVPGVPAML